MTGFDANGESDLLASVDSLNDSAQTTVVHREGGHEGYRIVLVQSESAIYDEVTKSEKVAFATQKSDHCEILIHKSLFSESRKKYLKSVLWHEIGHCAGKAHSENIADIMYYRARPLELYSESSLKSFFEVVLEATGLKSG